MKYKWHWTPRGLFRALIAIGLLVGAGYVGGTISTIMIVLGLLIMVYGYIATAVNVSRKKKEVEREQREVSNG